MLLWDTSAVLTALVHVVHYTLLYGGLLGLAVLLYLSRPGRPTSGRRTPSEHEQRLARLRESAASGRLAEEGSSAAPQPGRQPGRQPGSQPVELAGRVEGRATALPIAVVSSAAAAGVHAAAGPAHFDEGLLIGSFFLVSALAQLGWAVWLIFRPVSRALLGLAAAANAGVICLWLLTRTTGLPFELAEVEAVGAWDLAATAWEVALVVACVVVRRSVGFGRAERPLVDMVEWSLPARLWVGTSGVLLIVLSATGTPT